MYSKTHCHFCAKELELSPNKHCHYCDSCSYGYNVLEFTSGGYNIEFHISHYKFNIGTKTTIITEKHLPKFPMIRVPQVLLVTKDNYLEVVERAKNLQVFV